MEAATSSETQGQLVGMIECLWWKFTVRLRWAPGHLLLPNQFQKLLNCLLLTGRKKKNSGQSAKRNSGVTLTWHDVAFLINCHCWVAHLTGKVSREKFRKNVNKGGKVSEVVQTSMEIYNLRLALYTRQCEQRRGKWKSCIVYQQ